MKTFSAFLLVTVALLSYVATALLWDINQRYPVAHLVVALIGLGLLAAQLRESVNWKRITALAVASLLTIGFTWWTFSFSEYPENPEMAAVGTSLRTQLAALSLHDQDGAPVAPAALIAAKPVLFVFYRGHW